MKTIKQKILEVVEEIKCLRKDRFIIIDTEDNEVYSSRGLEKSQLKELQKPLAVDILSEEDINILSTLVNSRSIEHKYDIGGAVYSLRDAIVGNRIFVLDPLTMKIDVDYKDEIDREKFDWISSTYLIQMLLDCYILDMSKTNRETVDWFLGFMSSNNGYTISKSDGQYGSQLIINRQSKIIRPLNIISERDKLLLEIKDFKSLFDGIIS